MSVKIFISTVSDEFRAYRDVLRRDLTRHNVEVKVQEDFKGLGRGILDLLDVYIASCDAVVHLVGDMTGSAPGARDVKALLAKHADLPSDLPPVGNGDGVTYTQWEAWLALYHSKVLVIAKAAESAERGPKYAPTENSRAVQAAHLARLATIECFPGCTFTNADNLTKSVLGGAILDLLATTSAPTRAAALVGVQFTGETRIGTFVQGMDAGTAEKILEKLDHVSGALDGIQRRTEPNQYAVDEHPVFQEALREAKRMCEAGHTERASRAFMDAIEHEERLERERQEDRRRLRLRLLEEGVNYDHRAINAEAAFTKLRLIAEIVYPSNSKAQARYLADRASEYKELGTAKGDNSALLIAVSVFRWLAKDAINVER
jgi:hypothetical protein